MRIAVVTGASSGLGRTFAGQIDAVEKDIDEIWLIARRRERLEKLAEDLAHPCRIFDLDLTMEESITELEDALLEALLQPERRSAGQAGADRAQAEQAQKDRQGENNLRVGLFVNCAGYAKIGNYENVSRFDSVNMIDLNCKAAVNVTLILLPYMKGGDRIIHICSTAAFQPLQHMNIYAAGKAFLYNYTRALRMELLPRGIMVTAVCPWWVKDTEFISVATDNEINRDAAAAVRGFPLSTKQENVVKMALRDSRWGLPVSTPGVLCTLHRFFGKILPRTFMLYLWEVFRRI